MAFFEPNNRLYLALTLMEWRRLVRDGVIRIGDRIREMKSSLDMMEIVDLAPDLGDGCEDYVIAQLSADALSGLSAFRADRPYHRLLVREMVASFHPMTCKAQPLLEDRARDLGLQLQDPIGDESDFIDWQRESRLRGLKAHAGRLRIQFNLPNSAQSKINLILCMLKNEAKTKDIHIGTPSYGWAVAFTRSAPTDKKLKQRCNSFLDDMRKRPFNSRSFFPVLNTEAAGLAKELRKNEDPETLIPLAGESWVRQLGHLHFREQNPTNAAFENSLTWLIETTGQEWATCFLYVYCTAAVVLDKQKQMAWPTMSELAQLSRSTTAPHEPNPAQSEPNLARAEADNASEHSDRLPIEDAQEPSASEEETNKSTSPDALSDGEADPKTGLDNTSLSLGVESTNDAPRQKSDKS